MTRRMLAFCALFATAAAAPLGGCDNNNAGPAGPQGNPGPQGPKGDSAPFGIAAVFPTTAFLGRTTDLLVIGSATNWNAASTVSFSDPNLKVNSVTFLTPTALSVNVTIPPTAPESTPGVTVTTGDNVARITKNVIKVVSPLQVSMSPVMLPQGGMASLYVRMLDVTTPFDTRGVNIAFNNAAVTQVGAETVEPYVVQLTVAADVLAPLADIDMTITSGAGGETITSPRPKAFVVAQRNPVSLTAGTPSSGKLAAVTDSGLFRYIPPDMKSRFLQFVVTSPDSGGVVGTILPRSGKLGEALGSFSSRFGVAVTSNDPIWAIIYDGQFGVPAPYAYAVAVADTAAAAVSESGGNIGPNSADALAQLPALVSGSLVTNGMRTDDWYKIAVSGSSQQAPKKIHVATGGDALADVAVQVLDTDGFSVIAVTGNDDVHKDLVVPGITTDGTYYARVLPGPRFSTQHAAYKLFVEIK